MEKTQTRPLALFALALAVAPIAEASASDELRTSSAGPPTSIGAYGDLPLSFEANVGQAEPGVKFFARGDGYGLFLAPREATLRLRARASAPDAGSVELCLRLAGASPDANATPLEELSGPVNYFIGNDPAQWRRGVPTYGKVKYEAVYPGIDLVYYGKQRQLEYDFVVAPGADPSQIELEFTGGESRSPAALTSGSAGLPISDSADASSPQWLADVEVAERPAGRQVQQIGEARAMHAQITLDGGLDLQLAGGSVRWKRPIAWQEIAGHRIEVPCSYELNGDVVRFQLGAYDRTRALVIDPVLLYSTLLGGQNSSGASGVAVDSGGNAYFVGGIVSKIMLAKLDPSGTNLVFLSLLGGSGQNSPSAITRDGQGNIFIAGSTTSKDFPTTNGLQTVYSGTNHSGVATFENAYLLELSPDSSNILYSTYLGGTNGDIIAYGVGVDTNGNVYVAGRTGAGNYPVTAGAFRTVQPKDNNHRCGFVTKINPRLSGANSLIYSTLLGGTNDDAIYGLAVSPAGNAYVTGFTSSTNFPTTPGAFQTNRLGFSDAYAAELNSNGSGLVFSTLLGGSGNENYFNGAIAIDPDGNVYLAGQTGSADFPTTPGAAQRTFGGGRIQSVSAGDAFMAKLNPTGSALVFSTFYGGSLDETASSMAVDANGNVFVIGSTSSLNLPVRQPLYPPQRFDGAKTTDGGATWNGLDVGSLVVNTLAVDPLNSSNLYAGAARVGTDPVLYKSSDAGLTWLPAQSGLPTNVQLNVTALAIDPTQPNVLYAGLDSNFGIFKSVNGGVSWTPSGNGISCSQISALALDPHNPAKVFAVTLGCSGGQQQLYGSTNGGALWTLSTLPSPLAGAVAVDPTLPGVLYAGAFGTNGPTIYKSTDGGTTWAALGTGWPAQQSPRSIAVNPANSLVVYAGGGGGNGNPNAIFKSVDGGTNWFQVYQDQVNFNSLLLDPSHPDTIYAAETPLFAGQSSSVVNSVDGGTNWSTLTNLVSGSSLNSLTIDSLHPATLYVGKTFDGHSDAFVVELDRTGSNFVYSTYLGGTKAPGLVNPTTIGTSIAVDRSGDAFVGGGTSASDFPAMDFINPPFPGITSAFIGKISSASATAAPSLAISSGANHQITLSWSSSAAGFGLMTTTSLSPQTTWQPASNTVSDNGTTRSVVITNNLDRTNHFYRLQGL